MSQLTLSKPGWSSQTLFILAAIGSAVGLGNIWKFPYITGENGGGAFVLVYLACVLLIGIPVLLSEIALGRAGAANPVQGMANLAQKHRASPMWFLLGLNGVLASALILSFYTVVAGWALAYFYESMQGVFQTLTPAQVGTHFEGFLANPWALLFWHSLVALFTVMVVAKGVRSGIERAISWMMPGLFLILLVLLGYATTTGYFMQSFAFLFSPDFSKLSWEAVLIAMGHAFFTLSIGLGVMMVYGSYISPNSSIAKASMWIALADTLVALMAGLVIFAIVFANGLEPGAGPGLLFQTLPIAFGQMGGGWFFGSLFFALVVMAALSSAISLLEPAVSWFEQNWGIGRRKAAWLLGGLIWFIGIGTVLSFNQWADVHFIGTRSFFESVDFLTANIMLPLGGLLMLIFVAWVFDDAARQQQIDLPPWLMKGYLLDVRWLAPVAILMVFATNLVAAESVWFMVGAALLVYAGYVMNAMRKG